MRQIQLAKHTPSEIIMLALSCAMLEHRSSKPSEVAPSQRLKDLTFFLQEAVKVVPIESILHAIGYDELETAVQCAKALLHAQPNVPCSSEALVGLERAVVRMRTGLPGIVFDQLVSNACKLFSQPLEPTVSLTAPNRNNLHVTVNGSMYYPVNFFPLYSNVVRMSEIQREVMDKEDFQVQWEMPVEIFIPEAETRKTDPQIANQLEKVARNIDVKKNPDIICGLSIENVYPIDSARRHSMIDSTLKSPIEVLREARREIAQLLECSNEDLDSSTQGIQTGNEQMLSLVRDLIGNNLKICSSLIGGFMEEQIHIPLVNSEVGTAGLLTETSSPVAMGAWALFSLSFEELQNMVEKMQGNTLLLEIADYISIISTDKQLKETSNRSQMYAGKLQFLLQGMRNRTITCSSRYISYSLERQLCSNLKFDKDISVKTLIKKWDEIFEKDALSLVAKSHRSLVARWLKWAVLVHDLRESLAKYTCIGVTGLVNSGKSYLVSKLFDIQVIEQQCISHFIMHCILNVQIEVGTANRHRTTVPILYNLDGKINGLDVIDFPGVDDKDHSIPDLANLLLSLSQIIIFVVDYRYVQKHCVQYTVYISLH